jgi:hypothetical protein
MSCEQRQAEASRPSCSLRGACSIPKEHKTTYGIAAEGFDCVVIAADSTSTVFIFTQAGAPAGALELTTQLPLLFNALNHINAAHY